jgi:hypothetical protein
MFVPALAGGLLIIPLVEGMGVDTVLVELGVFVELFPQPVQASMAVTIAAAAIYLQVFIMLCSFTCGSLGRHVEK